MLPTPSTSHVAYGRIYEPAEDSYLLLDTLSSATETAFLHDRFRHGPAPLVCEVGTGSGVVLAFTTAQSKAIIGRTDMLSLGTDINNFACRATIKTVHGAVAEIRASSGDTLDNTPSPTSFLAAINANLTSPLRSGQVDILIFNPPYVPAPLPDLSKHDMYNTCSDGNQSSQAFDRDSHLLALSYAGGEDGMEVTNRLLDQLPNALSPARGVAYVLLCAQNKPEQVKQRIRAWPGQWTAETVGESGKKAGWEKLSILRIVRAKVELAS